MCTRVCILALTCAPWVAMALEPMQPAYIRSRSGQFLVQRWQPNTKPLLSANSVDMVRLEPTPLAVSCDRIRQALLQELAWPDQWASAISVVIRPHASAEEPVRIIAVRFKDGWGYQVELPPEVTEQRLLRAMVEVLLRERANRQALYQAAELPLWLAEGVAEYVRARSLGRLVLDSATLEVGHRRAGDALRPARQLFQKQSPLSLEQLSWPAQNDIHGEGAELFKACSHVLVHELLQLRDGRACLARMVDLLPAYLNWQSAFLKAYGEWFPDMTRFDKWWSLLAVHYSKRADHFYWTADQTLEQLSDILTVPLEVRLSADRLPMLTKVNLQKILVEWEFAQQEGLLVQKLNHLQALFMRCRPEQASLVSEYFHNLSQYLQFTRETLAQPVSRNRASANAHLIAVETSRRLDQLDEARRGQLLRLGLSSRP